MNTNIVKSDKSDQASILFTEELKKILFIIFALCIAIFMLKRPLYAGLEDMGDGTILDTDTGLQYLKDANYAMTTGYYLGLGYTYDTNGGMTYSDAELWAAGLNVAGHTDWRLPSSIRSGGDVCNMMACSDTELGHLYFLEGVTFQTPGVVTNLQGAYWTNTPPFPGSDYRIAFWFVGGNSQAVWTVQEGQPPMIMSAWAVRSAQNDDLDGDGFTFVQGDCNDADISVNPGATEIVLNGKDDDCNPATLDYIPPPPPQDEDGDGVVNSIDQCPATPVGEIVDQNGCSVSQRDSDGDGYTPGQGDCDDTNISINPAALDLCDGIDNDCNSTTADGTAETWYGAVTNCGVGVCASAGILTCSAGLQTDTCSAGSPLEITELTCTDNLDNDCDGAVDLTDANCSGVDYYCDIDGDTFISTAVSGSCSGMGCEPAGCLAAAGLDCNDADSTISPVAIEIANNSIDENCDGSDLLQSINCNDGGTIECVERIDGGSDNNNVVNAKPAGDLEHIFTVNVRDTSGDPPLSVKLFTVQRSTPLAEDFNIYDMTCSGNLILGGSCTYQTRLGPAAVHLFYFEALMFNGNIYRYPVTGYLPGPEIQTLTGYNLVGIPRDPGANKLDGQTAFGSSSTYRWDADLGYYTMVTAADPVIPGEGYFVTSGNTVLTLPEFGQYNDIASANYEYALKSGWNIISNPYTGNVLLSDIMVKKGVGVPVSWLEAVTSGWLVNAIYSYNGDEWGGTYRFETSDDGGFLVPWTGCWVYLEMNDDIYYLVIPKP